jgi:hypothetical protein
MANVRISIAATLALFVASAISLARGEEPDVKTAAEVWLRARQAEFAEYRFERQTDKPVELALAPRSVLNWSNPERGAGEGGVFLWTDAGQPQMIACAFEYGGSVKHEFHSLSTDPIDAARGVKAVHRFGPGVAWKELPGAAPRSARTALDGDAAAGGAVCRIDRSA